jgi:hypothetical protein
MTKDLLLLLWFDSSREHCRGQFPCTWNTGVKTYRVPSREVRLDPVNQSFNWGHWTRFSMTYCSMFCPSYVIVHYTLHYFQFPILSNYPCSCPDSTESDQVLPNIVYKCTNRNLIILDYFGGDVTSCEIWNSTHIKTLLNMKYIYVYEICFSDDATPYETVSRTLCPLDVNHRSEKPEERNFFVDFSTFSNHPLNFTLKATKVDDFQIR